MTRTWGRCDGLTAVLPLATGCPRQTPEQKYLGEHDIPTAPDIAEKWKGPYCTEADIADQWGHQLV